jgi:lipoyl(octanoyl) transferase
MVSVADGINETHLADRHSDELWVCELGTVPYRDALAIQTHVRERRQAGALPDVLLLLEHPPIYTRGRRSKENELTLGEDFYRSRGIEIFMTDRGGRVTYHGPGQLVGYPIMHVFDIGAHLRQMEQAIVDALLQEGIEARSRCEEGPDYTGVWVEDRKIASIGVHVSRGVSTHGFAINVQNDLEPFSWVIPCGLPDVKMTSLEKELGAITSTRPAAITSAQSPLDHGRTRGRASGPSQFSRRTASCFCSVHGRRERLVSPQRLGIEAPRAPALERLAIPA